LPIIVGHYRYHPPIWGNNEGTAGFVIGVLAIVIFKLDLERFQLPRTDEWIGCFGARRVFPAVLLSAL
jgi:hypothetical protein